MTVICELKSMLLCVRKSRQLAALLLLNTLVGVVQCNTEGIWAGVLYEKGFLGFLPDPTLDLVANELDGLPGAVTMPDTLYAVSNIAHALVFPAIVLVSIWVASCPEVRGRSWDVSAARGCRVCSALAARVGILAVPLVISYILYAIVLLGLTYLTVDITRDMAVIQIFAWRLALSSLLCLSFAAVCSVIALRFISGFDIIVVLLFYNYVCLLEQTMMGGVSIPSHITLLMWVCGLVSLSGSDVAMIVLFSIGTVAAAFAFAALPVWEK